MLVSLLTSNLTFAQLPTLKTDSTHIYKNIEAYSGRRKYTRLVYLLIFNPAAKSRDGKEIKNTPHKRLIYRSYATYEGKHIRYIIIQTLDPFGYSIADTNYSPQYYLPRTGNKLHVKSQPIAIRNLLLIRQNQIFDSLLVKESERLIRSQRYVRDVSFQVNAVPGSIDSVDILIREMDNWSIVPAGAASASHVNVNLLDRNFMGLGHEFQNDVAWNRTSGNYAYSTRYFVPNIVNTYINSTLHYGSDESGNFRKSIDINRPFFSPFARWAAGINLTKQNRRDYVYTYDSLYLLSRLKFNAQDFWVGDAVQLFKGNTENSRSTNFITGIRYYRIRYLEKPADVPGTQNIYSNENLYLASIGISTRTYLQDRYIFKYGVPEDIPVGRAFSLTGGYQGKNNSGRFYLGARISVGYYYPWGYLGSNSEIGTFLAKSKAEQGTASVSAVYFTPLLEIGVWKIRQFIKPQLIIGINRFAADSLTLNDGYGIDGFNSIALTGSSRLLFTVQTQSYSPWNVLGFHFGPFINYSFGVLGNTSSGFKNSNIFSQIGLGVLIKNENLVINSFQISFAFYPAIPGTGINVLKMNTLRTSDFGLRDFEIGKPAIVVYQ